MYLKAARLLEVEPLEHMVITLKCKSSAFNYAFNRSDLTYFFYFSTIFQSLANLRPYWLRIC